MRRALAAGMVATVLAGCGSDAKKPAAAKHDDRADVAKVVNAYLQAFGADDGAAMCATRLPAERTAFGSQAGTCEIAMRAVVKQAGAAGARTFGAVRVQASAVTISGNRAAVAVKIAGSSDTLKLARQGGRWYLYDDATTDPDHPTPAAPTHTATADDKAIATVVNRYQVALQHQDAAAACATRSKAERARAAKQAGTCTKAFKLVFQRQGELLSATGALRARAEAVRIKGDTAVVPVFDGSAPHATDELRVIREDGHWRLTPG